MYPLKKYILLLGIFLTGLLRAEPIATPYEGKAARARGRLDEIVFTQLQSLHLAPAADCSDSVFLRRVYLDVIGTLPSAAEARSFLEDKNPDKRKNLIDELLTRDEFADYWAMKWSDLLRVKAEYPINLWPNAAQAYHRWIVESIHANKPFDQFARELLTGNGSNFRVGPANFYRALPGRDPRAIARAVALTFMGCRAEKWDPKRLDGLAAFFAQISYKATGEWKEEIVFFDPAKSPPPGFPPATFPDGTLAAIPPGTDPRAVLADWLTETKNPWFARAIANRVWFWLMGRGVVQEPDDFRPDNPPANPELLDYLEEQVIAAHYDLKVLFRLILNSQTYQLSCLPRSDPENTVAHFGCYSLRRLDAEVLIDALDQITGATEKYSSAIPEPYTYVPEEIRSIALPDGSITSSFLEIFGRPARDTGLETERSNRVTATQRLYLLNSSQIQNKLNQGPRLQALLKDCQKHPKETFDLLYLSLLSRHPTSDEDKAIQTYAQGSKLNTREVALDLTWALINSDEFLYRH